MTFAVIVFLDAPSLLRPHCSIKKEEILHAPSEILDTPSPLSADVIYKRTVTDI